MSLGVFICSSLILILEIVPYNRMCVLIKPPTKSVLLIVLIQLFLRVRYTRGFFKLVRTLYLNVLNCSYHTHFYLYLFIYLLIYLFIYLFILFLESFRTSNSGPVGRNNSTEEIRVSLRICAKVTQCPIGSIEYYQ